MSTNTQTQSAWLYGCKTIADVARQILNKAIDKGGFDAYVCHHGTVKEGTVSVLDKGAKKVVRRYSVHQNNAIEGSPVRVTLTYTTDPEVAAA